MIKFPDLYRMVGKASGAEIAIIQRHYCSQMKMNGLCTMECFSLCGNSLKHAFDMARGEFVINPAGQLVVALRDEVGRQADKTYERVAETPKNALGENDISQDIFTELMREYEGKTTLR